MKTEKEVTVVDHKGGAIVFQLYHVCGTAVVRMIDKNSDLRVDFPACQFIYGMKRFSDEVIELKTVEEKGVK